MRIITIPNFHYPEIDVCNSINSLINICIIVCNITECINIKSINCKIVLNIVIKIKTIETTYSGIEGVLNYALETAKHSSQEVSGIEINIRIVYGV